MKKDQPSSTNKIFFSIFDINRDIIFPFPGAMGVEGDDIIELEGYVRVGAAITGADASLAASEFLFVV